MEAAAVVVDSGGCSVRLGLAGGAEPAAVFPNCTGKGKEDRQWMIGENLSQPCCVAIAQQSPVEGVREREHWQHQEIRIKRGVAKEV